MNIRQLLLLIGTFLKKPLYILPVYRATEETMEICNSEYGDAHFRSNKANAFRHALWNVLICKNINEKTKDKNKAVEWADKITALYEKVTKNDLLDEQMDLHNNRIGRKVFLDKIDSNKEEIVNFLLKFSQKARKTNNLEDLKKYQDDLVFIED